MSLQSAHVFIDWENIQVSLLDFYDEQIDSIAAIAALYRYLNQKQLEGVISVYANWSHPLFCAEKTIIEKHTHNWNIVSTPNIKNGADDRIKKDMKKVATDPISFILMSGDGHFISTVRNIQRQRARIRQDFHFHLLTLKGPCHRGVGHLETKKSYRLYHH